MVEEETKGNAIFSANDLERTYGSRKRLFLLSDAFHEKRILQEEVLIEYPNIPSATRPVPHNDEPHIPEPYEIGLLSSDDAESSEESSISEPYTSRIEEFRITTSESHLFNESELNDLVSDLDLPKVNAELLASKFKKWNLIQSSVNVCSFRTSTVFGPVFSTSTVFGHSF